MGKNLIKNFLKKHTRIYIYGFFILLIQIFLQTRIPKLLGITIDNLKNKYFDAVPKYIVFMVVFCIVSFILRYIWRYLIIGVSRELECFLREELFIHLQKLPQSFYNQTKTGDIIANSINDINAVRMTLGPGAALTLNTIGTTLFSIYSMTGIANLKLTLLCFLPIPFIVLIIYKLGFLIRKNFTLVQEKFGAISGKIQENICGVRVLKSYVQEEFETNSFYALNDEMKKANIKMVQISALLTPLIEILFGISFTINIIYGGNLVKNNIITVGEFIAFNSYLTIIMKPIISIGRIINLFQKGKASLERLNKVFDAAPYYIRNTSNFKNIEGSLKIKNLNFSYPHSEDLAVKNINISLKKGKTLGIIGSVGSGKTTLINLILKTYPVERGSIFLDDKDINDINFENISNNISYVPQDNFLFSTTIEENIRFFREEFDTPKIHNSSKVSVIYDSIMSLPQKFDTKVGERGVNLSGGQKQRICIARAVIKDNPIIIFDDCLSAVDAKTEKNILFNLKKYMKNKTCIIVSNRISSVKDADEILVMDKGEIIQRGTHKELIVQNGLYKKIYDYQANSKEGGLIE